MTTFFVIFFKKLVINRRVFLTSMPLNIIYTGLLSAFGLVIYAYFVRLGCDPLEANQVSSANQVPCSLFMSEIHLQTPVLPGTTFFA
jgi:hypothetical protein